VRGGKAERASGGEVEVEVEVEVEAMARSSEWQLERKRLSC
jgi:hypothetical protein